MNFVLLMAAALGISGLALLFARLLAGLKERIALGGRARGRIQVLDRAAVGPKQGVAVVRIDGREFAVSIGDGGVRTLAELQPDQEVEAVPPVPRTRRAWPLRAMLVAALLVPALVTPDVLHAQDVSSNPMETLMEMASVPFNAEGEEPLRLEGAVGVAVFLGLMAILPTLVLLMTSFTRILIVLHFLRQALGTQSAPPGQLLAALALMLTAFVMAPTLEVVNRDALQPWTAGDIEQVEMLTRAQVPMREFMLLQTREADLGRFIELSGAEQPETPEDLSMPVMISAFVTSELRTAFQIGFVLYLPFIVIDLVVASVLMSMGMFMLPPVMVSLPIKLLLFVMVDGWGLVVEGIVRSFTV